MLLASLKEAVLRCDDLFSAKLRMWGETPVFERITKIISQSGDSWFVCGGLLVVWFFARGALQRVLAYWGLAIAGTAFFILALKACIGRVRPKGDWGKVYRKFDPYSFPSGHAVRGGVISGLAWVMSPPPIAIALSVWAVWMALARVMSGVHYVSDVIAGGALGLFLGLFFGWSAEWVYRTLPILFDRSLWLALFR